MKAVLWTAYGPPDVLRLGEAPTPAPKDDEVRIRIRVATVTAGDCELRALKLPFYYALPMRAYVGLRKPARVIIPGMELAGEIESIGKAVTRFKPSDRVFGAPGFSMGAYAEYICLPEEPGAIEGVLAAMPAGSYEEAAAVPIGGLEALHYLRRADLRSGERILIVGAGGSIGTMAVQLAKCYGAEVAAVDRTEKVEMLRSLGAAHVIDYTREDFTESGATYDVIFDVAGKSSYSRSVRCLRPGGRYLLANPRPSHWVRRPWTSLRSGVKVIAGAATYTTEALTHLAALIEAGTVKPVIDRCYPLEQIVEAHRYVETGQKRGNVVITVGA